MCLTRFGRKFCVRYGVLFGLLLYALTDRFNGCPPPGAIGWFIGIGLLCYVRLYIHCFERSDLGSSVLSDLGQFARVIIRPWLSLCRLYNLLLFLVLFHSCCSYARMFGKMLVLEFHVSHSHSGWCLHYSLGEIGIALAESLPIKN